MLAIKKLMHDSLLTFKFRGTTLNHEELLLIAWEIIIIIDKLSTTPTTRQKQFETSAPTSR